MKNIIVAIVCIMMYSLQGRTQALDEKVTTTLDWGENQLKGSINGINTANTRRFPAWADQQWHLNVANSWVSGFFPGCLWLIYQHTSKTEWKDYATQWTDWLNGVQNITSIYTDLGFMMVPSYVRGYELTKNSAYPAVILKSAESYSKRWNEKIKVMDCWDKNQWLNDPSTISGAVDQLMNMDIFFEAFLLSHDSTYYKIGRDYAETVMNNIVREDFSSYHVVRYDVNTGAVVNKGTIQGYADSTTWARGQAWLIYGMTMVYRHTHDIRFLNTAIGAAGYFIDHLPEDYIPYWDFEAPNIPNEPKDASASAIVCSALFELIGYTNDAAEKTKFQKAAYSILESLTSDKYLNDQNVSHALLLHSTGNKPSNEQVDVSEIYADYYFLEALVRSQEYKYVTSANDFTAIASGNSKDFTLAQNYPNPFSGSTKITYDLKKSGQVSLKIYSISGQETTTLVDKFQQTGKYDINWSPQGLPDGIYIYRMQSGATSETKKLILQK